MRKGLRPLVPHPVPGVPPALHVRGSPCSNTPTPDQGGAANELISGDEVSGKTLGRAGQGVPRDKGGGDTAVDEAGPRCNRSSRAEGESRAEQKPRLTFRVKGD